jgi:arabinogalactan oligomer/maltooligosaccharide transport system permease protein
MSELAGLPPGTTVAEETPTTRTSGGGRRRGDPAPKVKLGPGRWFREIGWRHLVGVIAVVWALFPVSYLVSAALNPLGNVVTSTLIPQSFSLSNFTTLLDEQPFGTWARNSIIVCVCVVFVQLLFSALAAFAFSRFRFKGRRGGLLALLLIQMFPQFLAIVTIFLMFSTITDLWPAIGFNTPWGLMLLYLGGALGVNTWLMKGFLDTLPRELDESATMDGATHAQVFFRIILPLTAPILAVTGLLAFIGTVNEFLIANVFLTDSDAKTLAVGMYGLIAGERNSNFGVFCAGTLLTAVPTVLVFQLLQRYIVSGLTSGAVKG